MNNNTKKAVRQRKASRRQQIEVAKAEWYDYERLLADEKSSLGYGDLQWEKFLLVEPSEKEDSTINSQIIALQEQYKELIEQQKIIWAEDNVIAKFNELHAIVHVDQTYVLTEKYNTLGDQDFSLEGRQSFRAYYEDEIILCIDGKERCKADIWLQNPRRRKYKGIVFDPSTTEHRDGYYNLWRGFKQQAIKGNCSKYWAHAKDNICNGDEESFKYLRKWAAYVFQHPDKVHTAIVLCGSQGVGKNSFVDPLGELLGSHYAPLSSITELVSNFNYHLKDKVLIHANEALWGGNKKELGTVKAMVTESTCLIEGKGKDRIVVRNFKHIILSSNEDWPVHLDRDDRRFFVLKVSEAQKEKHEYFEALTNELIHGGYEALLFDLLNENLTGFDPRALPSNSNSFSIKMRSAESSDRYIYEALCEGGFSIGSDDSNPVWQAIIPKDLVYQDYVAWCTKNNEEILSKERFGKITKRTIPSATDTRPAGGSRVRCYKLPNLEETRKDFCRSYKEKPEHIFNDEIVE